MSEEKTKTCTRCEETFSVDKFYKRSKSLDGRQVYCKWCHNEKFKHWKANNRERYDEMVKSWHAANPGYTWSDKKRDLYFRSKYDITLKQYYELYEAQDGRCAICQCDTDSERLAGRGSLSVDHDHETGKVRGLLCFACNTGIGKLDDSPELLRAALEYLDGC